MKKIIAILLLGFVSFSNSILAEDKIGSQHEYGISLLGSYEYEETQFMHLRAGSQATDNELYNLGLLYNYKNAFINNGYFTELEFDSSFQSTTQTYWSNTTGTMEDIDVEIFNSRLLYGLKISDKLMLKTGLGYRYLYHYWQNRQSSTGAWGYDREQDYTFIPIIAELKAPIPELNIDGELKVEFDHVIDGTNNSYAAYLGGSNKDNQFTNDDGYIWKVSYAANLSDLTIEPYYEFMSIEESSVTNSSQEPSNTTKEIGLKLKKVLYTSNQSDVSDYKTYLNDDGYYFGVQLLKSEVESGFYAPTGTASIDEEVDYGYSLVTGTNISDMFDLEVAFNQFGQSQLNCNADDTIKTDGRYNNSANTAGTTLTCSSDSTSVVIESYSASVGIKPKYEYSFNNDTTVTLNANVGYHRWDQSETTVVAATSTAVVDHSGLDTYYGIGLSTAYNNLDLSLNLLEHNMFYDASSLGVSLNYKF